MGKILSKIVFKDHDIKYHLYKYYFEYQYPNDGIWLCQNCGQIKGISIVCNPTLKINNL